MKGIATVALRMGISCTGLTGKAGEFSGTFGGLKHILEYRKPFSALSARQGGKAGMCLRRLEVRGGRPLCGEITIQGSKNAVLPVLAACLLGDGPCVIENCPRITDVKDTAAILESLGCIVFRKGNTIIVDGSHASGCMVKTEEASRIRSSVLFLGALLGRMRKAVIPQPGGCAIGNRPIDLHLSALATLGAVIDTEEEGSEAEHFPKRAEEKASLQKNGTLTGRRITADGSGLHGGSVTLPFPSVGATENTILASVLGAGETWIHGAAREPEIDELCEFLNRRGADILRMESGAIRIAAVQKLHGVTYRMHPDRIVAGTYLLAAAASRGGIRIQNGGGLAGELEPLLSRMRRMGCEIHLEAGAKLCLRAERRLKALPYTETAPYPGFPTDLQSQIMAVCAVAEGTSRIREALFENRFRTVRELKKMGADIRIEENCAVIEGVGRLHGASVFAADLRGGAALVLAALCAEGESRIYDIEYIERGYEDISRDLCMLGADVRLCREDRA